MTDGQKIQLMRDAFARLAVEQPAHNTIKTWALEANDLPAVALLDLYNAIHNHPKHPKAEG